MAGAWVQISREALAESLDLVQYRVVDGRPTVWDRSTLSDANPFPTMRLWSRRRA